MEQNKDQSGAAVRSEAVVMTDYEMDTVMAEWVRTSNSCITLCRMIEAAVLRKVSARAADALSEPSVLTALDLAELEHVAKKADPIYTDLYGDRYSQGSWSRVDLDKEQDDFIAAFKPATVLALIAAVKSCAADALDSQPTYTVAPPVLDDASWRAGIQAFRSALNEMTGRDGYVVQETYKAIYASLSSRPTDGGVRND